MKSMNNVKLFLARNGIFVALVALIAFFTSVNPNFLSFGNMQNVVLQAAEIGLIALPLALLVMSGSVDLSVGSVASLGAVTAGVVMGATQSAVIGILAGLAVGLVAGIINGFLVSLLGLNPIVVTLGTLSVWGGMALLITQGRTLPSRQLAPAFLNIGTATVGPVPIQIIILVAAIIAAWYVLNRNRVGKEILAIGGNQRAAFLMGLKVRSVRFGLFVASGFFASLAGILIAAKVQSASPTIGSGMEIAALTIVLLGGVAFEGGVGRISGVVAGLLFFRVLRNGLVFMQASPFLQTIIIGLTLIVAVALDTSIQKIVKRSWAQLGKKAVEDAVSQPEQKSSLVS